MLHSPFLNMAWRPDITRLCVGQSGLLRRICPRSWEIYPRSCDPRVQTDTCLRWSVIWPQASAGQLFITPERLEDCLLLTKRKIRNFCLSHLVQQINTTGNEGNFCDGLIGILISVKLVGLHELISLLAHTTRGFVLGRVHSISLLCLKQGQGAPGRLSQSQSLWRT